MTQTLRERFGDIAVDLAAVAGAVSMTYGMELIYHPAGFIVGGAFLLAGAWMAARGSVDI